jgi:PKD repeat protein
VTRKLFGAGNSGAAGIASEGEAVEHGSWSAPFRRLATALLALVLVAANLSVITAVVTAATATPAAADTAPDPGTPETVSAAALPTVQINGVVWDQVIVGNRVFVTGQFTSARPAGSDPGQNETPRSNILAYDLTTGNLITSWAPSLNQQGMEIKASPDGSTIYVGGDFDQVNGQWRGRIAALDAQTGALLPFNPSANSRVDAIAVNGNTVYFGGDFTAVGPDVNTAVPRTRLAAANATTGALLSWAPTADRIVNTMVVHAGSGRVIVGGGFNFLNGSQQWGMGSLDGSTAAVQPWSANTIIRDHDSGAAINSLTTDGTKIYGVGWTYVGGGSSSNFEGVFAADPMTGNIIWIDGGRGDNYDVAVNNGVVYSVGHPHDWGMLNWNPQYPGTWQFQRAMAINAEPSPTLTDAYGTDSTWQWFHGMTAAQPLHWLPTLTGGTYTGLGQAAWSVATNGDYTVLGGEFPRVNGTDQQGLVRFAKRAISPLVDPVQNYTELTPTLTPLGAGTIRVGWKAAWDRDNARVTVEVLRGDTTATSTVLKTFTTNTSWFNRPPLGFVDATAPPGTTQTYRIRVKDPFGNGFAGPPATVTVPSGTPAATSTYASSVMTDNPEWYWRMGEASGTKAYDNSGSNDLTLNSANTRNIAGALLSESNAATNFPGTTSTSTVQGSVPYWEAGPQTFSLEAWLRTSSGNGGKIIGFGDSNTGRSGADGNDRLLYMNNAGQIYFGVRPDMGTRITINSPSAYKDNAWHQVVGTLGADGMKLYVDGNLVASNASVTKAQVYRGFWRVGGDRLSSWPSTPNREAITANLDELAVYPYAVSLGHIRAHYLASGRTASFPNILPTASFTSTSHYLTASPDATGSFDDDGTISTYAWDFGDGTTGTGVKPNHTYATAGTYNVSLTVTDNRGGTNSTTRTVTVTDPPANILPTASFTTGITSRTATFTSTSTDEDGTIASYAWDFGDGTTGSGAAPQHVYAASGTYTVGLIVTDNSGGTASVTGTATITDQYAADNFDRTVSNALGTADNGGPWTVSGAASSFSVANGAARIVDPVGGTRSGYVTSVQQTDLDIKSLFSVDTASTGGGAYVSVIGRRVSNGNDYRLKVRYVAGGSVIAYLARTVGGTETVLASATIPGLTVNPGDQLRSRFLVTGTDTTTVRAKVWRKGALEPANWQVTNTAATPAVLQAPGHIGVSLYVSGSWTGAAPTLALDSITAGPDSGPPVDVPPTASFTSNPDYLTAWFDATASTDSDDSIASYGWNFGDGTTATGATPHHKYAAAGTYTVTLTVTDLGGATGTKTATVEVVDAPPPSAFFVTSLSFLTASFDATGSADVDGTIVSYAWDFGDGTTGTGVTVDHTYAVGGNYTVTLTVTDDDGHTGVSSEAFDFGEAPPPTASFTYTAQFRTATFDASASSDADGTIAAYDWDFGDGTTGTGVNPQHTYAAGGTYNVVLTVTDNTGHTGSMTGPVVVTDPPAQYALDAFGRTIANGFGTADTGGAWTGTTSGSASVANGVGRILGAVGANRAAYLASVQQADVDYSADVALDSAATGGGAYVYLIGRRVSSGNDYRLKIRYLAGGSVAAYVVHTVAGVETVVGSATVPGLTVAAGDVLRARFSVSGNSPTTLRAKVWRASSTEPASWLVTATDDTPPSLQAAGGLGILLYVSGSWVGTPPAVTVDNLDVHALVN